MSGQQKAMEYINTLERDSLYFSFLLIHIYQNKNYNTTWKQDKGI